MRRIYKFPFEIGLPAQVAVPTGSVLLGCGLQGTRAAAWFDTDTDGYTSEHIPLLAALTGQAAPDPQHWAYLNTAVADLPGLFVVHFFCGSRVRRRGAR